mmetsp:Transcript_12403/g.1857  ORF Transcript_12403/g.1857 Transcript_12403/m.1857 type:complete len:91 (+) Transcript_12403:3956-4228(+)
MIRIIDAFNIRDHDGTVHFAEVLWVLASTVSGADMSDTIPCDTMRSIYKSLPRKFPDLNQIPSHEEKYFENTAARTLAAHIIYHGLKRAK